MKAAVEEFKLVWNLGTFFESNASSGCDRLELM
jgi:hypothetical protein